MRTVKISPKHHEEVNEYVENGQAVYLVVIRKLFAIDEVERIVVGSEFLAKAVAKKTTEMQVKKGAFDDCVYIATPSQVELTESEEK